MKWRHCHKHSRRKIAFEQIAKRLVVVFSLAAIHIDSIRAADQTEDHRQSPCRQNVTFLVFVPCLQGFIEDTAANQVLGLGESASLLERLDNCDILAGVAMKLAIERVNRADSNILPGMSLLREETLFRSDQAESIKQANDTFVAQARALRDAFRFINSDDHFGVIGLSNPETAGFWAPIFQRSNLLTVSYDVIGTDPDKASTFYRTLPSIIAANIGRLHLIAEFEWYRIALITSNDRHFLEMGEQFSLLFKAFLKEKGADRIRGNIWITSFSESPESALREVSYLSRDINIIFGFFNSTDARNVLCHANSLGLISENHAWILPAYYNPNWWKLSNETSLKNRKCSNDEMNKILESIIFVSNVKYPPVDLALEDFHLMLMNKTLDLFPSLTEESLEPYLLRSRATSAYDAVTLLAKSVGVAFNQGGESCTDTTLIQVTLEKIFLECEYCRLNLGCTHSDNLTHHFCGSDFSSTPIREQFAQYYPYLHDKNLRSNHILNLYGQVSFSQFSDGEDCLVGLVWNFTNSDENFSGFTSKIISLEDLDESLFATRLNLSKRNFITEQSRCPMTFKWKGRAGPPQSDAIILYGFPLHQIVSVAIVIGVVIFIAVMFLIFNIVWRKNKTMKSTSPWLNVILISGILIRLPSLLFFLFIQSVALYHFSVELVNPLCHFAYSHFIGTTIFISTLLMKNWRLYRIFNNKTQKYIGNELTDKRLSIGIFVLVLPTVIVFVVMVSFNLHLEVIPFPDPLRLQFHKFSYCTVDDVIIETFIWTMNIYNIILLILLLMISFRASLIHLQRFQLEAMFSLRAVSLSFIPYLSLEIFRLLYQFTASFTVEKIQYLYWIEFSSNFILMTVIMFLLFGPNVYMVVKNTLNERRKVILPNKSKNLVIRYNQLKKERAKLKEQLLEINTMIKRLSAEKKHQMMSLPQSEVNKLPPLQEKDLEHSNRSKHSAHTADSSQCIETLFSYLSMNEPHKTYSSNDGESLTNGTSTPADTEIVSVEMTNGQYNATEIDCHSLNDESMLGANESKVTLCTMVSSSSDLDEYESELSGETVADPHVHVIITCPKLVTPEPVQYH